MKKNTFIMYAALLAFGSCTNEVNEEGFVDKANTISFNAYSSKTRAYDAGDVTITEMKEGSFGVVGYEFNNTLYLGSANKAIEQVWKKDDSVTGGGYWDYKNESDAKYWPTTGNMDFFAYFPYSETGDVFATTKNDTDPVMTITNNSGKQDVLFAKVANRSQIDRVHLYFNHALSKIASMNIKVTASDIEVVVSKVEILNTSTKGKILVDNSGNAKYSDGTEPRTFELQSPVTLNSNVGDVNLFNNSANGYVFATNSTIHHNVYGTAKPMWNGNKGTLNGGNLSTSDFVCIRLTCKVTAGGTYLVGNENTDGVMYIPMCATIEGTEINELLAGRRYYYNIIMSSNVGFKDNGDPVNIAKIHFGVNEVKNWDDVTSITIEL